MKYLCFTIAAFLLASQTGSHAASPVTTYIPAEQVSGAFDKGVPLLETGT